MRSPLAASIAIAAGMIVLAGYFVSSPILLNVRSLLLEWSMLLAAVAALVAIINLVISHIGRAARGESRLFSFVVLAAFFITLVFGLIVGTSNIGFERIITNIQVPIETTMLGITSISLAYAAYYFVRTRKGWTNLVFMVSVVFFLLANGWLLVFGQSLPILGEIISAAQKIPLAGSRGMLIGISLGSLVAGLRILTGIDRPYSG